jgi:FkbM family methyltransferase
MQSKRLAKSGTNSKEPFSTSSLELIPTCIIMFSQNDEEYFTLNYFKHQAPGSLNFLDIGANDGLTFSNIRQLALNGWSGVCLEPSPKAYLKLEENMKSLPNVSTYNFGISSFSGEMEFHDSGNWVNSEAPVSVLGTLHESNKDRFFGMEWERIRCDFVTFEDFIRIHKAGSKFDFISIDVEGHDMIVLSQINLHKVRCQLICLEHAQNEETIRGFTEYCEGFGMFEVHRNVDNIFFSI